MVREHVHLPAPGTAKERGHHCRGSVKSKIQWLQVPPSCSSLPRGYDIIIAHGSPVCKHSKGSCPQPSLGHLAYGTGEDTSIPNVFTYTPKSEQTGYLNGIAAGLGTKTNVIGLIGSVDGGDAARY